QLWSNPSTGSGTTLRQAQESPFDRLRNHPSAGSGAGHLQNQRVIRITAPELVEGTKALAKDPINRYRTLSLPKGSIKTYQIGRIDPGNIHRREQKHRCDKQ